MKKSSFSPLNIQLLLLILLIFIFSNNCGESSAWVVAMEEWRLVSTTSQENDSIEIEISKLSDSSLTVGGSWVYDYADYRITCSYMIGEATRENDSILIITTTGSCVYPDGSPYEDETSVFDLTIKGVFKSGSSSGTWIAYFTNTFYWPDSMNWNFTGTRKSGSGVTL